MQGNRRKKHANIQQPPIITHTIAALPHGAPTTVCCSMNMQTLGHQCGTQLTHMLCWVHVLCIRCVACDQCVSCEYGLCCNSRPPKKRHDIPLLLRTINLQVKHTHSIAANSRQQHCFLFSRACCTHDASREWKRHAIVEQRAHDQRAWVITHSTGQYSLLPPQMVWWGICVWFAVIVERFIAVPVCVCFSSMESRAVLHRHKAFSIIYTIHHHHNRTIRIRIICKLS